MVYFESDFKDGCLVVGLSPIFTREPGTIDCMPSVVVFLKVPKPYLHEFCRETGKTPNG